MTRDETLAVCSHAATLHPDLDARALRSLLVETYPDGDRSAIGLVVRRRQRRDGTPCAVPGCLGLAVATCAVPIGHVVCDLPLCDGCQGVAR